MATLILKSTSGIALPQEPFPAEYDYLTWEEPPRLAGAADVPLWFDAPQRGKRPLFLRDFRRLYVTARGVVPEVAERDLVPFFTGIREASALLGLQRAAQSITYDGRPLGARRAGRARWLRSMADRYLELTDQRPVPVAE
jgi:hypothetical protein